jgi:hypothetical protein
MKFFIVATVGMATGLGLGQTWRMRKQASARPYWKGRSVLDRDGPDVGLPRLSSVGGTSIETRKATTFRPTSPMRARPIAS